MTARPSPRTDADTTRPQPGLRARVLVMSVAAALVVLAMTVLGDDEPSPSSSTSSSQAVASSPPAGLPAQQSAGKHLPRAKPVRLLIPKIAVDAPFTDLAIGSSGQLDPPPADDVNLVGWFAKGAAPGERGTSVVAGHVDTATSPAVFARLGELEKGDTFQVERADGRTASFVVDSAETFSKDDFPDDRVYADTPQAQIRLITCAGDYDRAVKDYTDNLVVFAHLA
ncbi:class F sortase [Streptomyces sp. NPDC052415]|uniref:class F sortase n=1 Tax=Streptomyces sp. NPDC052415 TaxID=3365690 RepID=UPI0037CF5CE2